MNFMPLKKLLCNLKIRTKLIILFIVIKVIPVILIAGIALYGVESLYKFFNKNTSELRETTKDVVTTTAKKAIEDSIVALDRKSQSSLEKMSMNIADAVAKFLYERDADLLLLASLPREKKIYDVFIASKKRQILEEHKDHYHYDDATSTWTNDEVFSSEKIETKAELSDNSREFKKIDPIQYHSTSIPLYKEIAFFDLEGQEKIKVSALSPQKTNISIKDNTYIKAEKYYDKVMKLKKGEIYVSEVIGAYVPSQVIGTFTKEKAQKAGIAFEPERHGYAGRENPVGKQFEGIVRFVTPVFEGEKKVGFVSMALDHRHIMEFTDTVDPLSYSRDDASDASKGNYAFMWDHLGRNISHVRDYFIVGYDPTSGEKVTPWLGREVEEAFVASGSTDIEQFLETYPTFDAQSLKKKPSISSIKKGHIALDCRYLNFAPQCQGWMQLTRDGGLGSFIIYWSNVWKLTTAATIPYFTGQYGNSPRGFGFVTIGANVDEFHKAAETTKQNLDFILGFNLDKIDKMIDHAENRTKEQVDFILNELTITTAVLILLMIFIAIWLSNLLRNRLLLLLRGAKEYSKNNLEYRINVDSRDEIGELADSFNDMATSLKQHIDKEKEYKETLENRIQKRTQQLVTLNEKIQSELEIKEAQEEKLKVFAKVFNNTAEAIVITDIHGKILQVNPAFSHITQYKAEEVLGTTHKDLKSHRHPPEFYKEIWSTILGKKTWAGEIWNRKKDGTLYPALLSIVPVLNKQGEISHFAGIQHDITVIKENEEALHRQAYYDPLTKLANRTLGYDRLEHAIANAEEHGHMIAVMFLDLDKFKQVNDTMGHDIGDLLLCEIGNRLSSVCKHSDTISRLGGDEFLVILEDVEKYDEVISVVEKIIKSIAEPIEIENQIIHMSTSMGVTFYPEDGISSQKLLKNADIAMYRAKARGRGVYEIFTPELGIQVKEAVKLEHELKEALNNDEFIMHYQPMFDFESREVIGFEALMRWQHKDGLRYPDRFIEMLEHSRMIINATCSVLPKMFTFIRQINEQYKKTYILSINISSIHFALDDFSDHLIKATRTTGVKPSCICLEVTETIFLSDIQTVAKKLAELKLLGFRISLDDFGTGYSSLEYLKELPLDKIKIDRAFVQGLPDVEGDVAITTSVCSLGENFGLEVIAEGVETQEQYDFLRNLGCNALQGYLFSKPLPENALKEFLDQYHP